MKKNSFKIHDTVEVVDLRISQRSFKGSDGVYREPKIGDIGIVRDPYDTRNTSRSCLVEMMDSNGNTVWLANFSSDELIEVEADYPREMRTLTVYLLVVLAMFIVGKLRSIFGGYRYFCDGLSSCNASGALIEFNEVIQREFYGFLFVCFMSLITTFFVLRLRRLSKEQRLVRVE